MRLKETQADAEIHAHAALSSGAESESRGPSLRFAFSRGLEMKPHLFQGASCPHGEVGRVALRRRGQFTVE